LTEKSPDKALEWFNARAQRADINEAESDALLYGQAIALQRKGDVGDARKILQNLMDRDQNLAYELQMADLDLQYGDPQNAIQRLTDLYHNFPGNHAISMQYATALLHDRDPEKAGTAAVVLKQQLLSHPDDPQLYELYARSSNIAGDDVRAKEAIAETYYLRGSVHEAAMQLQELAGRDDLDYYQRARITARINQIRLELAELGKEDS